MNFTHEDELLLAETVLRHLREGQTEETAFQEVSKHLGYSLKACHETWYNKLFDQFKSSVDIAKKTNEVKEKHGIEEKSEPKEDGFLNTLNQLKNEYETVKQKLENAQQEIKILKQENHRLKTQSIDQNEYNEFVAILNRANQLIEKKPS